jgi:hypothetical protein
MSRITKYLKQKCTYEKLKRGTDGKVLLDKFGEPQYEPPIVIKCRRETTIQDVQTNTGAILKSSTRYFTDDTHMIQANDKLDGKVVLKNQEYTNQFGKAEGFESYV